ncbi:MAG: B12-binding domain-containing radical SAM protein [Verrucomicrobia bacterium]|nr:B12-binding domain-containing radical SAM protein [Verrucomicrobiota bacterium]MCF7707389.1 B12-binding domain-containing radical SAM protein [Verrucomicrobiota bacterium]
MPDIILTTMNARYTHTALGLRYLLANMGPLRERTGIVEFDLGKRPRDMAERILDEDPKIIGLGVYIWNVTLVTELTDILKQIRPDIVLVLGGPEVEHAHHNPPAVHSADYVIAGEADLAFPELCKHILEGSPPPNKTVAAAPPPLPLLEFPYKFYSDKDIATRTLYVEATRGCPFDCEFCMSALDKKVRFFPLEPFKRELDNLIDRGARHFKFVDRSFNITQNTAHEIIDFFLGRQKEDMSVHFEIVPDRISGELIRKIGCFPPGMIQLETGIQTFNPSVASRISRRQDTARIEENMRRLRHNTGAHIHADLIAGLPGESLVSFGDGFNRLLALEPHEIQVGVLKCLRGAPISRPGAHPELAFNPHPPYEILESDQMDFNTLQRINRFARYWDIIYNSGRFPRTCRFFAHESRDPFQTFLHFTDWFFERIKRTHEISLVSVAEHLFEFIKENTSTTPAEIASIIYADYRAAGRRKRPAFLEKYIIA